MKKKLKVIIPTIILTALVCLSVSAITHAETDNSNLDAAIRLLQKAHNSKTKPVTECAASESSASFLYEILKEEQKQTEILQNIEKRCNAGGIKID